LVESTNKYLEKCTTYLFTHFFAALPRQSGDDGHDEDESTQRPLKSKLVRSSKKKKSSKSEKKKVQHSPETRPDETGEPVTEEDVSPFSSINI